LSSSAKRRKGKKRLFKKGKKKKERGFPAKKIRERGGSFHSVRVEGDKEKKLVPSSQKRGKEHLIL